MTPETTCDISIASDDHDHLMAHLFPGDHDEHGAVLHAGIAVCGSALRLNVQNVERAELGRDYAAGEFGYRALNPTFIHRQIVRCRNLRLAYLAVHNHDSDLHVGFSQIDLKSHERGYPALRDIGKGVSFGALVFGHRSVAADIWLPDGTCSKLGTYRVIGPTIKRLYSSPARGGGTGRGEHRGRRPRLRRETCFGFMTLSPKWIPSRPFST